MLTVLFFLFAAVVLMKRSYFDFIVKTYVNQTTSHDAHNQTVNETAERTCLDSEERGTWITDECRCIYLNPIDQGYARTTVEIILWLSALVFFMIKLTELYRTNWKFYLLLLLKHTSKMLFILSLVCVLLLLPARLACLVDLEEILTVLGIILMSTYFLYFGRFEEQYFSRKKS
jgi:hypothetical protein